MKLELKSSKKQVNKASGWEENIVFAVIDLDRSKAYPINFVCLLPVDLKPRTKQPSIFMQTFGDKAPQLAKTLLLKALSGEHDAEVKNEINKRLKTFEIAPPLEAQCAVCKRTFQPKKYGRFQQRVCQACRQVQGT
jgi:hypothetical protein